MSMWEYKFVSFDGGIDSSKLEWIRRNPYISMSDDEAKIAITILDEFMGTSRERKETLARESELDFEHFEMVYSVWNEGSRDDWRHYTALLKKFLKDNDQQTSWYELAEKNPPYQPVTLNEVLSLLGPEGWELVYVENSTAVLKRQVSSESRD